MCCYGCFSCHIVAASVQYVYDIAVPQYLVIQASAAAVVVAAVVVALFVSDVDAYIADRYLHYVQ